MLVTTISLFVILGISLIFLCVQFLLFRRFWERRDENFFRARRPKITQVFHWCISFGLGVVYPMLLVSDYLSIRSGSHPNQFFLAAQVLHEVYLIALTGIGFLRMFMIWYDHKFHQAMFDAQWKTQVLRSAGEDKFIDHRRDCGNVKFMSKVLLVYGFVTTTIVVCLSIVLLRKRNVDKTLFVISRVAFVTPLVIALMLFWWSLSPVSDIYRIGSEMKLVALTLFTIIIFNLFIVLAQPGTVADEIDFAVQILQNFILILVQTEYVLKLWKNELRNLEGILRRPSVENRHGSPSTEWQLYDVFNQRSAAEQLMRHCVEELSVENILFLVEALQYRSHLFNAFGVPEEENAFKLKYVLENRTPPYESEFIGPENVQHMQIEIRNSVWLPHNRKIQGAGAKRARSLSHSALPLEETQHILAQINELSTNLFVKYIRRDAPLCLNLSHEIRERLEKFFLQTDDGKARYIAERYSDVKSISELTLLECEFLYYVFDEAFDEIYTVLKRDTFVRFQRQWGRPRHGTMSSVAV